jgi:hypothetical protein
VRSVVRRLALAGLAAAVLSACSPPAGQGATGAGFSSRVSEDLSGEYAPAAPVAVGGKALEGLYLGHADDFAAFERGERVPDFAPVMLMLDGDRVLPTGYRVTDETVRFEGQAGRTPVRLEAEIDLDALAEARRTLGGDGVVIRGTLEVGGERAAVAFSRATGG